MKIVGKRRHLLLRSNARDNSQRSISAWTCTSSELGTFEAVIDLHQVLLDVVKDPMHARWKSLEAGMAEILQDHFENHQNPHETIHRMWTLLNLDANSNSLKSKARGQTEH
jgi:hypothetical protein